MNRRIGLGTWPVDHSQVCRDELHYLVGLKLKLEPHELSRLIEELDEVEEPKDLVDIKLPASLLEVGDFSHYMH